MLDWATLAVVLIVGLIVGQLLPSYFRKKGENLATKEDLGPITRIAESIKAEYQLLLERTKPFTAEETLRREAFFNRKLDAFYSALELVCRKFSANEMHISDKGVVLEPASSGSVTEAEVNLAYSRLAMFASSGAVLQRFHDIVSTQSSPSAVADLVDSMRQDLGFGERIVDSSAYRYIIGVERRTRALRNEHGPVGDVGFVEPVRRMPNER